MRGGTGMSGSAGTRTRRTRRARADVPRAKVIYVRLNGDEDARLRTAAGENGLAVGAFVAGAARSVASGHVVSAAQATRAEIRELNQAWTQLARLGTNLNQAVRATNATGEVGAQLLGHARVCERAMRR